MDLIAATISRRQAFNVKSKMNHCQYIFKKTYKKKQTHKVTKQVGIDKRHLMKCVLQRKTWIVSIFEKRLYFHFAKRVLTCFFLTLCLSIQS